MISPVKVWRNQKRITRYLGKQGTIQSWTVIRVPPGTFSDQAPYPVVLVRFEDSTHMTVQLVDFREEHLRIGQHVTTVVRRVVKPDPSGIIPYGIKVKPVREV